MNRIQRASVEAAIAPIVLTGVSTPLPPSLPALTDTKCAWQNVYARAGRRACAWRASGQGTCRRREVPLCRSALVVNCLNETPTISLCSCVNATVPPQESKMFVQLMVGDLASRHPISVAYLIEAFT